MVFGTSAIEAYMKIGFYVPSGNYIVTSGLRFSDDHSSVWVAICNSWDLIFVSLD
jgi:hypothetical protein